MTADSLRDELRRRIDRVEERIRAACARAGRPHGDVTLVAVTKSAPEAVLPLLPELGLTHLGESRPQQLWRRAALVDNVSWHLVGHLQRNKVERTLTLARLIHSADSLRLLQALEAEARKRNQPADVLLEVKTSPEPAKLGFAPEDLPGLVPSLREFRHVRVRGLMTMAPFEHEPARCRSYFADLARLRDELRPALAGCHDLAELSMGMTNDFEVAVEEGATLVRIGSALFEELAGSGS